MYNVIAGIIVFIFTIVYIISRVEKFILSRCTLDIILGVCRYIWQAIVTCKL